MRNNINDRETNPSRRGKHHLGRRTAQCKHPDRRPTIVTTGTQNNHHDAYAYAYQHVRIELSTERFIDRIICKVGNTQKKQ